MMNSFTVKEAISKLVLSQNLEDYEADAAMEEIMAGAATPSQIAAFLTAIRIKGPTVEELAAFALTMRRHAHSIRPNISSKLVDTCGTGGDKLKTFNISTIAALVTAGAGVSVAKHGNRSFTSRCGSADLLERLGVNINADPQKVQSSIERANIGFMFAPVFHPAMKHAGPTRKEIGIRTIFNVLGPLTNPAGAKRQVVGVYDESLVLTLARVLRKLGAEEAMVVHGLDGIDEISLVGRTRAARVSQGEIEELILEPSKFGLKHRSFDEVSAEGADLEEYATVAFNIISGNGTNSTKESATREMVLMNTSAALVTAGVVDTYLDGVELAKSSIQSGKALEKLVSLVQITAGDISRIESLAKPKIERLQ
jgi:anthranilate phosphoribosyltransferase